MSRQRRAYQQQAMFAPDKFLAPGAKREGLRRFFLLWLRQGGKTTVFGEQSLREMMRYKGRLVTFASANLNMGSEMVEKEAKGWTEMLEDLRAEALAGKKRLEMGMRDKEDGTEFKALPADTNWAGLADLMERNRFELRLWHSNTVCSRTKIIAANLRTARSWSGSVKLDEAPFVQDLRNLLAELEPIFATDPTFTFLMAGTLPPDYAHYSYELCMPEDGRDPGSEEEFPADPNGHWYKNRAGLWVHRVSVDDAALAGRKVYDPDTGVEQTVEENRDMSLDREGWDRSNRHKRPLVGTSAVSPVTLDACQQRGKSRGLAGPDEPPPGWLDMIGKGKLALGLDLATTEGKKSNPAALAVVEQNGMDYWVRLILWWKTSNPAVTRDKVKQVLQALKNSGRRPRQLAVDATNERFFATDLRTHVGTLCNVTLVSGSDGAEYRGEGMNMKAYLGNLLANTAEDGRLSLPQHKYVADDFARVTRAAGSFVAVVGANGEHGDTFDAVKLALYGLTGAGEVHAEGVALGGTGAPAEPRDAGRFGAPGPAALAI